MTPPVVVAVMLATKFATGTTFTVIALLLVPVTAGLLDITRIRYPVPATAPAGIVALIAPKLPSSDNVPIFVGDAKEPVGPDNCAV
jgi:hypothetical protein